MIHEKIVFKNKQSAKLIESKSSNVEQQFSRTENIRRISIISIEIFDDASENAKTFLSHSKHESVEILIEKR
jgi:hypothetical protein